MGQLDFAFVDASPVRGPAPNLWLAASQKARPKTIQRILEAPGGMIVDSVRGEGATSPDDVIMVRGRGERGFSVYARPDVDGEELLPRLNAFVAEATSARPGMERVREFMVVGMGVQGVGLSVPPSSATGLERAMARLRHRSIRRHPAAIASTCAGLERRWPEWTPTLLRGVVRREHADALLRLGASLDAWRPTALSAARIFEKAGRPALAQSTLRAHRSDDDRQFELPFETRHERSGRGIHDLGYRIEKLFARRLQMPSRLSWGCASVRAGGVWHWRRIGSVEVPEESICRALAGVEGRTLGVCAEFSDREPSQPRRLRAGCETELAVLLGIAGRAGSKPGNYMVQVRSSSCRISPPAAKNQVGVLSEFMVCPQRPGRHRLEVELRTASDRTASVFLVLNA